MSKQKMHHSHHGFMGGVSEPKPSAHTPSSQSVPPMGSDDIQQYGNDVPSQSEPNMDAGEGGDVPRAAVEPSAFTDRPANKRNKP